MGHFSLKQRYFFPGRILANKLEGLGIRQLPCKVPVPGADL
jgi:hypothetical protein